MKINPIIISVLAAVIVSAALLLSDNTQFPGNFSGRIVLSSFGAAIALLLYRPLASKPIAGGTNKPLFTWGQYGVAFGVGILATALFTFIVR